MAAAGMYLVEVFQSTSFIGVQITGGLSLKDLLRGKAKVEPIGSSAALITRKKPSLEASVDVGWGYAWELASPSDD